MRNYNRLNVGSLSKKDMDSRMAEATRRRASERYKELSVKSAAQAVLEKDHEAAIIKMRQLSSLMLETQPRPGFLFSLTQNSSLLSGPGNRNLVDFLMACDAIGCALTPKAWVENLSGKSLAVVIKDFDESDPDIKKDPRYILIQTAAGQSILSGHGIKKVSGFGFASSYRPVPVWRGSRFRNSL